MRINTQRAGNLRNHAKHSSSNSLLWILTGLALVSALVGVCLLSLSFDHDPRNIEKPILPLVLVMAFAGAIYLLALRKTNLLRNRWLLIWIFGIGLVARLLMFFTPILEDDHYRYLWDGGVVASGFNPYQYAPKAFLTPSETIIPSELKILAKEAGTILQHVNHPELRTIYPPLAQGTFALAHWISPWSLSAWRVVLLVTDVSTLILLSYVLFIFGFPMKGLVVYWWNPLLIKEIYNSGHMDVLLFPFLLATFFLPVDNIICSDQAFSALRRVSRYGRYCCFRLCCDRSGANPDACFWGFSFLFSPLVSCFFLYYIPVWVNSPGFLLMHHTGR